MKNVVFCSLIVITVLNTNTQVRREKRKKKQTLTNTVRRNKFRKNKKPTKKDRKSSDLIRIVESSPLHPPIQMDFYRASAAVADCSA